MTTGTLLIAGGFILFGFTLAWMCGWPYSACRRCKGTGFIPVECTCHPSIECGPGRAARLLRNSHESKCPHFRKLEIPTAPCPECAPNETLLSQADSWEAPWASCWAC